MSYAKLRSTAAKMNCTIDRVDMTSGVDITVDSPAGFVFSANGCHCLVDCSTKPFKPDYTDLITRMGYGLAPCDDPECEICEESRS